MRLCDSSKISIRFPGAPKFILTSIVTHDQESKSQISKKQEKKNPFRAWTQTQKVPDEPEQSLEEGGWSSFEDEDDEDEGDYESPDETMEGNDGNEVDYESPAEDVNPDSDGDYEPPPPNDEPPHHGVILPSKSIQSTPVYVDRPTTAPVPPQRPLPSPGPFLSASKGRYQPNHNVPSLNDDKRTVKPLKTGPAIDRRTKPSLPLLQAMSATNSSVQGTRTVPEKVVPKIPKPPLPAEKKWDGSRMSSTSPRPSRPYNTNSDKEDHSGPSRPVPSPANSNTFPLRNPPKSLQKPFTLGASSAHAESFHSGSLPPQSQQGDVNRSYSQAEGKKVVSKYGIPDIEKQVESSLDEDWYVGNINRQDAEEALRTIDQDGTFLVRNSSKKTTPHPFVLMVLFNDKVYNVQIRYDQRQSVYMLGTGGKEHFQSVSQMIDYFTRTPLLLIDGKDRDLRYQCLLKHSAGRV
ncbi:hypothetical protein NDU88_006132 [Pleurodeles waltl]|uniref:SH2 domain-containing protein n=1 Tax=Pleurodeles waltl TaxID=8319 RepID=A0AAV7PIW8_PLEWA|nr:hypothetical protein NDU88_006132 [Pleurodeles waltl]